VADQDGKRAFVRMRWGLVPRWWSKPLKELRAATFNARAETVETKPSKRFRRRWSGVGFLSHLRSLSATMSQKSSVPQAVSFVSQVLKRDSLEGVPAHKQAPSNHPRAQAGCGLISGVNVEKYPENEAPFAIGAYPNALRKWPSICWPKRMISKNCQANESGMKSKTGSGFHSRRV
jgi:hypothetical protein